MTKSYFNLRKSWWSCAILRSIRKVISKTIYWEYHYVDYERYKQFLLSFYTSLEKKHSYKISFRFLTGTYFVIDFI